VCAPRSNPICQVFDEAGGWRHDHESDDGEFCMARLLDPLGLLHHMAAEFNRRADAAGIPRPLELGLLVDGRKCQIALGRKGAAIHSDRLGRSYLRLNVADFTRLVLGQLDWDRALGEGRVEPSTILAKEAGITLFPSLPLWRPPLDELTAQREI
jgi:hypothetical protein